MGRLAVHHRGERQSIGIGVVAEYAWRGNSKLLTGHRRIVIVSGDRNGIDGDGHRRHIGGRRSIGVIVGEAVRAGKAGIRRVAEGAVAGECQCAIGGTGGEHCGQRVAVGIGVVAEYARRGDVQRGAGLYGITVISGGRYGVDGDGHRGRRGGRKTVRGGVGEGLRAVVIGIRRVAEGAVGVQRHRAIGGLGDDCRDERQPFGIGIIGKQPSAASTVSVVPCTIE